jgi:hypothetical protein
MTRQRVHGLDTPFCEWIRSQPTLDSVRHALTVNDCDLILHKYKTVVDRVGSRGLQMLMWVEIKTHSAMPSAEQRQTLFDNHQLLCEKRKRLIDSITGGKRSVWHFGVFVLSLSGTTPDDSNTIRWCRFNDRGDLISNVISRTDLMDILSFAVDPTACKSLGTATRRHHSEKTLVVQERMPLGFLTEVLIKRTS